MGGKGLPPRGTRWEPWLLLPLVTPLSRLHRLCLIAFVVFVQWVIGRGGKFVQRVCSVFTKCFTWYHNFSLSWLVVSEPLQLGVLSALISSRTLGWRLDGGESSRMCVKVAVGGLITSSYHPFGSWLSFHLLKASVIFFLKIEWSRSEVTRQHLLINFYVMLRWIGPSLLNFAKNKHLTLPNEDTFDLQTHYFKRH